MTPSEPRLLVESAVCRSDRAGVNRHGYGDAVTWRPMSGFDRRRPARTEKYLLTLVDLDFLKRFDREKIKLSYRWPIGFRFGGPLHKAFTEKIFEIFLEHLVGKVNSFKGQKPDVPGVSVKLVQFILTNSSYQDLLKESAALIEKYTNESRVQLAINPTKQLESVSFMVGIDKFDAIAGAFGGL